MYNHNEHYLMFCILQSIVLTIQNVCRLDFLQLRTSEALLSFQNEQLFVFNDKQSTQYHKNHSGLMNETFWTWRLCEWWRHENRWQSSVRGVFDFNCVTRGIQHITERESKNTFELFCEGPLSCWRRKRIRKLFQYNCLHWVLRVLSSSLKLTILYVTSYELFIYHSYRWIGGIRGTHT